MNNRFSHIKVLALLIVGIFILAACGTIEVGLEPDALSTQPATTEPATPEPSPAATEQEEPSPTPAPADTPPASAIATETPLSDAASSALWATYRDPDAGFGYAFPCYWVSQGRSLVSYDEAFFMDHGIRGHWADGDPPAGAIKLEIAAFEYADSGIEPGTSLEEAVAQAIDDTIVAAEPVTLGGKEALRVQLEGTIFPGDETNEIYFFQRSPESMLLLSVLPRSALSSPDVQGLIESLALAADEPIAIPAADPESRLDGRELYFDQEAGYCFQYPADYALEAYPPSGIPYLGQIATLKLERPFYTLGLTSTALRVGEQSTLDELVTNFLNGLPEDAASQVERNPVERVGGVDFQVGHEPAEFLENVPGADGSRDILMKHDDRLYRLSFVPSVDNNPQAAPDLENLFLVVTTSFSFLPMDN